MYSKSREKRDRNRYMWPDLRYGPNGECKLFYAPHEVPEGWTAKPDIPYETPEQISLDKEKMIAELTAKGVKVNPIWGKAQLKKVLDDCSSSGPGRI